MDDKEKLDTIASMCTNALTNTSLITVDQQRLLMNILEVVNEIDLTENLPTFNPVIIDHTIISCDASILKNPGGPASVGVVVETPLSGKTAKYVYSQGSNANTSVQAEYDAVYFGLMNLSHIEVIEPIEIRSDCQLIIQQLRGEAACNLEALQKKRDAILELCQTKKVKFVWRPRNSTPELKQANYAAQDYLKVKRH